MGEDAAAAWMAYRLAAEILDRVLAQDWDGAQSSLGRLRQCGPSGLPRVLLAWCDAFLNHANAGPGGGVVRVEECLWAPGDDAGPVGEAHRWAIALITARLRGDRQEFIRLSRSLGDDPVQGAACVSALVSVVAVGIQSMPYGWARPVAGTEDR